MSLLVPRLFTALAVNACLLGGVAAAQTPKVGDAAPDFTMSGATKDGVTPKPVTLSNYRGQTVVLAFFPRARSSGCTHQMQAYRDRYASLFHKGDKVTLIAISDDPDTTLVAWAREQNFPFLFASDVGGKVGQVYGTYDADRVIDLRTLLVVGPDGKVTYVAAPFRELVETSYSDLGTAINTTVASKSAAGTSR
jgi:thioredoxin-dependent peroxiredoxin